MKYQLNKGVVTVTSETLEEAQKLIALAFDEPEVRKHKPHKKHDFLKQCPECGKGFKGKAAIGVHRSKAHGVKFANTEKNHQYYLKWKMKKALKNPVTNDFKEIWK